jgi:hypothetical protein
MRGSLAKTLGVGRRSEYLEDVPAVALGLYPVYRDAVLVALSWFAVLLLVKGEVGGVGFPDVVP